MSLLKTLGLGATVLTAIAALGAGCVSSETLPPPGPKYPDETAFCKALAEAVCNSNVVDACYGAVNDENNAKCRQAYAAEGCNPGNYNYHYQGSEACIEAQKGIYGDARLTLEEIESADETCLLALHDPGVAGKACIVDAECDATDELRCVSKPGQPGTCQIPEEVDGGFACTQPNQVCTEQFYCDGNNCIARPTDGTCSETIPCPEDAPCNVDPVTMEGTCVALKGDGEACSADAECSGGFCSSATGTCRANLVLGADGCDPFLP